MRNECTHTDTHSTAAHSLLFMFCRGNLGMLAFAFSLWLFFLFYIAKEEKSIENELVCVEKLL